MMIYMIFFVSEAKVVKFKDSERHATKEVGHDSAKTDNADTENRNVKDPCAKKCAGCDGMLSSCLFIFI